MKTVVIKTPDLGVTFERIIGVLSGVLRSSMMPVKKLNLEIASRSILACDVTGRVIGKNISYWLNIFRVKIGMKAPLFRIFIPKTRRPLSCIAGFALEYIQGTSPDSEPYFEIYHLNQKLDHNMTRTPALQSQTFCRSLASGRNWLQVCWVWECPRSNNLYAPFVLPSPLLNRGTMHILCSEMF